MILWQAKSAANLFAKLYNTQMALVMLMTQRLFSLEQISDAMRQWRGIAG
jgi:hypothetical protein